MQTFVDGRRARRERSQRLILQACRDLMQEGELRPRVVEMVRRTGLSRATLYFSFSSMDQLRLEAAGDPETRACIVGRLFGPAGSGALPPDQLDRIVHAAVLGRVCPDACVSDA